MSNEPIRTPLPRGAVSDILAIMDEYAHAHAAAVSAAKDAEIAKLREYLDAAKVVGVRQETLIMEQERRIKVLRNALSECYGALPTDTDGDFLREIRAALGDKT